MGRYFAELQLLLAFVAHHGLQGHFHDHGDLPHLFRLPGNAHHGNGLFPIAYQQIDAVLYTQKCIPVGNRRNLHIGADHGIGRFMKRTDPLGVPAGDDDALVIHDVDVVVRVFGDALHKFLGQVGIEHPGLLLPMHRKDTLRHVGDGYVLVKL